MKANTTYRSGVHGRHVTATYKATGIKRQQHNPLIEALPEAPNQTEVMVEALRRNGNAVGYLLFDGEQHGFRQAANIKRCLDAELTFYAIEVFRIGLTF
jgi:hypothetical protein